MTWLQSPVIVVWLPILLLQRRRVYPHPAIAFRLRPKVYLRYEMAFRLRPRAFLHSETAFRRRSEIYLQWHLPI